MAAETRETTAPNPRWWESYLVRYFLGFVVGAVCVVVLCAELGIVTATDGKSILESNSEWTAIVIGLGFLGLAYCYLVSAPITVLHAGRYGRGLIDGHSRFFWLGWAMTLVGVIGFRVPFYFNGVTAAVVLFGAVGCSGWAAAVFIDCGSRSETGDLYVAHEIFGRTVPIPSRIDYVVIQSGLMAVGLYSAASILPTETASPWSVHAYLLLGMPVIWIGLVQYAVMWRVMKDEGPINHFYARLVRARLKNGAKEFRDTYTHLREHSNSIFIALVEISFLAMLIAVWRVMNPELTSHKNVVDRNTFYVMALALLAVWMLPTVFMWSRANAMERFFAERPDLYVSEESDI